MPIEIQSTQQSKYMAALMHVSAGSNTIVGVF